MRDEMATLASGRRGGSSPGTAPEWGISHRSPREMMAKIERLRAALQEVADAKSFGDALDIACNALRPQGRALEQVAHEAEEADTAKALDVIDRDFRS